MLPSAASGNVNCWIIYPVVLSVSAVGDRQGWKLKLQLLILSVTSKDNSLIIKVIMEFDLGNGKKKPFEIIVVEYLQTAPWYI